jgi:hypothetical protein
MPHWRHCALSGPVLWKRQNNAIGLVNIPDPLHLALYVVEK